MKQSWGKWLNYLSLMKHTASSWTLVHFMFTVLLMAAWSGAHCQTICGTDSTLVTVAVSTDGWGGELYWELHLSGGSCGDGSAALWGGNPDAACGGGADGVSSELGNYENNITIVSEGVCASNLDSLTLIHRDNFGDGGSQFVVAFDDYPALGFQGTGEGNVWSFLPVLMAGDSPCLADTIQVGSSYVGSLEGLTVSPQEPAPPALGCGAFGGWCEGGLSNTLWLRWEVPQEGGVYEISTCNEMTTFDTQLALWGTDDCSEFSAFELLNANDDAGCGLGAYRSTLLTPCLVGGETLYLQVDGYYGATGEVEVSIVESAPESWQVDVAIQDLSCNLATTFDPDGGLTANTNVGPQSVDWSWEGPFGFGADDWQLGPLLPGTYHLTASFCGQTFQSQYNVNEPPPFEFDVYLAPDCPGGTMVAELDIDGETDGIEVSWTMGEIGLEGLEVSGLPEGLCEVQVTNANGCESSQLFWVNAVGVPEVDLGPDLFGCAGDAFTLVAPLQGGLSYAWSTGQQGALAVIETDSSGTVVVGVEVSDGQGCTATDAVILTLDDCESSIEDLGGEMQFLRVHPNPFVDELMVQLPTGRNESSLQVHDVSGRTVDCQWVREGEFVRTTLNVPAGVYLVRCGSNPEVVRVLKN